MKTRTLLLGCLLAMAVQAQESRRELWTWKDANGVTQYSDRPVPGAKRVELISVTPAPTPAASAPQAAAGAATARPAAAAPLQYQELEFITPQDEETFYGADTSVDVRLRSEPALAEGHRLVLYIDGRRVGEGYQHTLTGVERGAHALTAVIFDDQANERMRSAPRVFHIRQATTIAPRAVGPNLKPPPKPTPK